MRPYTQLTQEQRYQIYAFLKVGFSQSAVSLEVGVHRSTISRELRRNRGKKGYRPKQAHGLAVRRRLQATKFIKMTPQLVDIIADLIRQDFSPEQVSGFLRKTQRINISHETIYQYVLYDKANGGTLFRHLRRSNRKRKKRYGSQNRRGQIRDRVGIDDRPAIVNTKKRTGDWEIDTLIGKGHKGSLLTLVERKTKYTIIKKLPDRQASSVADATIDVLSPFSKKVFTITSDNGKEFAQHHRISHQLKANVYFAHPYHAWERGLNENTNGLIRQYFPKKTNFESITDDKVLFVMDRLNNRPRKTLGFATPHEMFFASLNKKAA